MHFPALNVVRYGDGFFRSFQDRLLEKGKTKMQRFVALQRKLLLLMWTLWNKNEHFEADFYQKKQQQQKQKQESITENSSNNEKSKEGELGLLFFFSLLFNKS